MNTIPAIVNETLPAFFQKPRDDEKSHNKFRDGCVFWVFF